MVILIILLDSSLFLCIPMSLSNTASPTLNFDSSPLAETSSNFNDEWITTPHDGDTSVTISEDVAVAHDAPLRKSTRVDNRPVWWQDYDILDYNLNSQTVNSVVTKYPVLDFDH